MEERLPIGQILMNKGYLNQQQLTEALEYQCKLPSSSYMPVGKILVEFGYVTETQVQEALNQQPKFQHPPIGQILVKEGLIHEGQLAHVLALQHQSEHSQKKLGTILIEQGYATREAIEETLKRYYTRYGMPKSQ